MISLPISIRRLGMLLKSVDTLKKVDLSDVGRTSEKDVVQFAGQAKVKHNIVVKREFDLL